MSLFDVIAGTPDGVFAVDRHQRIAFWNDAAQQILGFDADSVLGRGCYAVIGGTDRSGCTLCEKGCSIFCASLRGELSQTRDVQVHARGGARKWLSVTTFVLPSRYRELSLLAHVFRDGTRAWESAFRIEQAIGSLVVHPGPSNPPHPRGPLTRAEREVLRLLAAGASTDLICERLAIRRTTVRTHVQHVMEKLAVHTRLEAVASASRSGLIGLPTE